MLLEDNMITFMKKELKKFQKLLSLDYPECSVLEGEDEEPRKSSREALVKITVDFLRRLKQEELAERLQSKLLDAACPRKLKCGLKKKFQCVFEGIAKAGNPALLNQIYTELYITEGGTEVSDPPADGIRHVHPGQLVLEEVWEDGIEGRAKVHEQDPGVGSRSVQMLQDEVQGYVDGVVYRPVGSVGELQGIQEGGREGFEVGQNQALK
ncbi:uncharacterized protein LOC121648844 [Melanotaenia boesemani]|uniref:uncharacterized protein LOC121648844 n=1 Tax=Melanotaenia boesemani TaxID=1250792 RepID=UPI001C050B24|nr:uncharacterized protein LOC121648844 [Melanotaenia boesemani]